MNALSPSIRCLVTLVCTLLLLGSTMAFRFSGSFSGRGKK
uniref:Secreted protein n=1 Tax=Haemonchus contortus TaxID=6289 RepID=A0A7I4Y1Y6_HAECO